VGGAEVWGGEDGGGETEGGRPGGRVRQWVVLRPGRVCGKRAQGERL